MNNEAEIIDNKKLLLTRLSKVEGQIKGIQRMVELDKPCGEILTQISATRSAINKVGSLLLEKYTKDCLVDSINEDRKFNQKVLDEFLTNIQKYLKNNN